MAITRMKSTFQHINENMMRKPKIKKMIGLRKVPQM